MEECPNGPSGLHKLKFVSRVLLGTRLFDLFVCVHCGEETYFENKSKGYDSKEVKKEYKDGTP